MKVIREIVEAYYEYVVFTDDETKAFDLVEINSDEAHEISNGLIYKKTIRHEIVNDFKPDDFVIKRISRLKEKEEENEQVIPQRKPRGRPRKKK